MTTTYVKVNDREFEISAEYIGDTLWEPAGGLGGMENYNNNLITVAGDSDTEEFQCWSSLADPYCFDDGGHGPYQAFVLLCQEAWDVLEGDADSFLDPSEFDDPADYYKALSDMKESMQENADKLMAVGLDEDMILLVSNSESDSDYRVEEQDGIEIIVPLGR